MLGPFNCAAARLPICKQSLYYDNQQPLQYEATGFTIKRNKLYSKAIRPYKQIMKLATTKRAEIIRRFLLNSIKASNSHFLHDAMETFELTRQAIHRHLTALIKMGCLAAEGNTRARRYILGPVRFHKAEFSLNGLKESDVYYRDFGFIFNDLPRELESICHYGFTEMLNNAIDHSEGSIVGVEVERTRELIMIRI